jgi:hypothetical protein
MKKIRMSLMALAAIAGLGSAFAITPKHHTAGVTYYGYKDSNGDARWATTPPARTSCASDDKALACTITSTSANVTSLVNAFPAQTSIVNGAGSMYQ